jgi:4-hydroxy-2-oxoheptanedioate aldolase
MNERDGSAQASLYEAASAARQQAAQAFRLRELWDARRPMVGGWCSIPSTLSAEVMAAAGFDWVCIDTQHGLIGYEAMTAMLQALDARGAPTFVRVPWNEPSAIQKALDAGADGVIVPMVGSAAEAEAAVGACRYPPLGYRSWGPVRASLRTPGYDPQTANRGLLCVVMVETVEGVEHVDEIASTAGVDGILIGPWDLSLSSSHGVETPGDKASDLELIETVLAACERHGIVAGIASPTAAHLIRWAGMGFRFFQLSGDVPFLSGGARSTLAEARAGLQESAAVRDG